ncbi:MAG: RNA 2',3'-cyclic phosphodiesterase [bacterium]
MRLFIALPVTGEFLRRTLELQDRLKSAVTGVKWVEPANIHLTLHFLGEVSSDRMEAIKAAISCAAHFRKFHIALGGAGAFPGVSSPRVLWAGITEGSAELILLAEVLGKGLSENGFTAEDRRFFPHITIGRIRRPQQIQSLDEILQKASSFAEPAVLPVDSVELMESKPAAAGTCKAAAPPDSASPSQDRKAWEDGKSRGRESRFDEPEAQKRDGRRPYGGAEAESAAEPQYFRPVMGNCVRAKCRLGPSGPIYNTLHVQRFDHMPGRAL